MKWRDLLGEWGLTKLHLKAGFVEAEFAPRDTDRDAAWQLYVELATRVSTQALSADQGSDRQALASIYSLFPATRTILKASGPSAQNFARVAIAVLNVVLRPFLTSWHVRLESDVPLSASESNRFRKELESVRCDLVAYAKVLADIADVESLA